jgi:chloramphenicol-sensitive protein RarD
MSTERSGSGRGLVYGVLAYATWGLAPLYWQLLKPASATEILAHRIIWSLVFLVILNQVRKSWSDITAVLRQPRLVKLLIAASGFITLNWGLYIWSVVNDHVIDASLGYFINPLINVVWGVFMFREQLRKLQWVAFAIAGAGVLFVTVDAGALPWIGLTLGMTFSAYGAIKKMANVDAVESLTIETLLLLPFALGYLLFIEWDGTAAFLHAGATQAMWSMMAGVATAVPLLAFGAAAVRIPYSTMGILQYLSPSIQFIIGFTILGEAMTTGRWTGFAIVWFALAIFSVDAIRHGRRFAQSEE